MHANNQFSDKFLYGGGLLSSVFLFLLQHNPCLKCLLSYGLFAGYLSLCCVFTHKTDYISHEVNAQWYKNVWVLNHLQY